MQIVFPPFVCIFALTKILVAICMLMLQSLATFSKHEVRYLRYEEVEQTIGLFAGSGLQGSEITNSDDWNLWIRKQDTEVRARIEGGVEDSISNLILQGTSYTGLSRIEGGENAITATGELTEEAQARVKALAGALQAGSRSDRLKFVQQFLTRKNVRTNEVEMLLSKNLARFANEQRMYQEKLDEAGRSAAADADSMQVLLTRGTLYESRGLSVDTSLLPNYALEDTLQSLAAKGVAPKPIKRIAVIGPGLDFADKRDGYDFYPVQTVQPFAVMEAVLRTKLGNPEQLNVVTVDLNPMVNQHISNLSRRARAGKSYVVQLPRDLDASLTPQAMAYWQRFGAILGQRTKALPVPPALGRVALRAVAITPEYAGRLEALDLDIVAQTADFPVAQGFDLVVATNVLVYYNRFEQGLAMANITRMMKPRAIFLCNSVLPAQHDPQLVFLGRRTVKYSETAGYGDDVVVYQKR